MNKVSGADIMLEIVNGEEIEIEMVEQPKPQDEEMNALFSELLGKVKDEMKTNGLKRAIQAVIECGLVADIVDQVIKDPTRSVEFKDKTGQYLKLLKELCESDVEETDHQFFIRLLGTFGHSLSYLTGAHDKIVEPSPMTILLQDTFLKNLGLNPEKSPEEG